MKIIHEPSVYLIGKQQINDAELDRFMADHGVTWESDSEVAAEVITETAGRTCYLSFAKPRPGGNAAYLGHIKETSHGSVFEHAVWTFLITGVSRSLTHELVRHRAGFAYSQLSQRYVDESVAEFVAPHDLREEIEAGMRLWRESWEVCRFTDDEYEVLMDGLAHFTKEEIIGIEWIRAVSQSQATYKTLANYLAKVAENQGITATEARKYARQAARSVLPNATETKITVTGNARALRHFIEQRGSQFADPEIRKLAVKMLGILQVEAPNLFGDYTKHPLPDGTFDIQTPYKKV